MLVEMTEDYLSRVQALVESLEDIFGPTNQTRELSPLVNSSESSEELEEVFEVVIPPAKLSERSRPDAVVNKSKGSRAQVRIRSCDASSPCIF